MKMFRTCLLAVSLVCLIAFFTGCEHKELCFNHNHTASLNIIFDWKYAPGANPESMYVWFFPHNGGDPVQYHFPGKERGAAQLASGKYDVLCLNGDTEWFSYNAGRNMDDFKVAAMDGALLSVMAIESSDVPRAEETYEQDVMSPLEMLYGSCLREVEILSSKENTIILCPEEKVCHYTVEIVNVKNLEYVSRLSGTLSGMAGEMFPATDRLTGKPSILPFGMTKTGAKTIRGEFLTFGHCPLPAVPHKIVIYGILNQGGRQYKVYGDTDDPVTPQIHGAADSRNVFIKLDGLEFSNTEQPNGGMNPSIDGWGNVNIDVIM